MSIEGFEKEKMELFTLFSMTQALKSVADNASFSQAQGIVNQYRALRHRLISIDPDADNLLPEIEVKTGIVDMEELLGDAKVAINQIMTYLNAKALPTYLELMGQITRWMKEQGIVPPAEPLTKLIPILSALGLSSRWAVASSALCLLEVVVNHKLVELGMSAEGSFEDRVKRLNLKAKERGIDIPNLLAPAFYTVRNKVTHGGKEPSQDELDTIIRFLELLFQRTSQLKT